MSFLHRHGRLLAVGVSCAGLGAGAGAIASAGAATHSAATAHARAGGWSGAGRWSGARPAARAHGLIGRGVHGDLVVRTATGYATVTFDRGTIDSVSGQQLTLTEGLAAHPYRTVTLTVPSDAVVRDNRTSTTLSHLSQGERVLVLTGPKRTWVIAHTPRTAGWSGR